MEVLSTSPHSVLTACCGDVDRALSYMRKGRDPENLPRWKGGECPTKGSPNLTLICSLKEARQGLRPLTQEVLNASQNLMHVTEKPDCLLRSAVSNLRNSI